MDCPCFFCQHPTTIGADGTACPLVCLRAQHDEQSFVLAVLHKYLDERPRPVDVIFMYWTDPFGRSKLLNIDVKMDRGVPKAIHPPYQAHLLDALGRPLEWTVNVWRSADQTELVPLRTVKVKDTDFQKDDLEKVKVMLGRECTQSQRRAAVRPTSPAAEAGGRPAATGRPAKNPRKGPKQAPARAFATEEEVEAENERDRAAFSWRPVHDASTWTAANVVHYLSIFDEPIECLSFSNPRLAPFPRQHLLDYDIVFVHPTTGQHITVVTHEVNINAIHSLKVVYKQQLEDDPEFEKRVMRTRLRTVGFK